MSKARDGLEKVAKKTVGYVANRYFDNYIEVLSDLRDRVMREGISTQSTTKQIDDLVEQIKKIKEQIKKPETKEKDIRDNLNSVKVEVNKLKNLIDANREAMLTAAKNKTLPAHLENLFIALSKQRKIIKNTDQTAESIKKARDEEKRLMGILSSIKIHKDAIKKHAIDIPNDKNYSRDNNQAFYGTLSLMIIDRIKFIENLIKEEQELKHIPDYQVPVDIQHHIETLNKDLKTIQSRVHEGIDAFTELLKVEKDKVEKDKDKIKILEDRQADLAKQEFDIASALFSLAHRDFHVAMKKIEEAGVQFTNANRIQISEEAKENIKMLLPVLKDPANRIKTENVTTGITQDNLHAIAYRLYFIGLLLEEAKGADPQDLRKYKQNIGELTAIVQAELSVINERLKNKNVLDYEKEWISNIIPPNIIEECISAVNAKGIIIPSLGSIDSVLKKSAPQGVKRELENIYTIPELREFLRDASKSEKEKSQSEFIDYTATLALKNLDRLFDKEGKIKNPLPVDAQAIYNYLYLNLQSYTYTKGGQNALNFIHQEILDQLNPDPANKRVLPYNEEIDKTTHERNIVPELEKADYDLVRKKFRTEYETNIKSLDSATKKALLNKEEYFSLLPELDKHKRWVADTKKEIYAFRETLYTKLMKVTRDNDPILKKMFEDAIHETSRYLKRLEKIEDRLNQTEFKTGRTDLMIYGELSQDDGFKVTKDPSVRVSTGGGIHKIADVPDLNGLKIKNEIKFDLNGIPKKVDVISHIVNDKAKSVYGFDLEFEGNLLHLLNAETTKAKNAIGMTTAEIPNMRIVQVAAHIIENLRTTTEYPGNDVVIDMNLIYKAILERLNKMDDKTVAEHFNLNINDTAALSQMRKQAAIKLTHTITEAMGLYCKRNTIQEHRSEMENELGLNEPIPIDIITPKINTESYEIAKSIGLKNHPLKTGDDKYFKKQLILINDELKKKDKKTGEKLTAHEASNTPRLKN